MDLIVRAAQVLRPFDRSGLTRTVLSIRWPSRQDSVFASVEIRWFRSGSLAAALREAVLTWPMPPVVDARTDTYLIDQTSLLGVKLRAATSLEIKQRTSENGIRRKGPLEGYVEGWAKWAFALDPAPTVPPPPPDISRPPRAWVEIEKQRFLQKYEFLASKSLHPVESTEFPASGASFELTELAVNGANWWTLAIESFGNEATLMAAFDAVLNELSCQPWCPDLSASDSLSYPEWLRFALNDETPGGR